MQSLNTFPTIREDDYYTTFELEVEDKHGQPINNSEIWIYNWSESCNGKIEELYNRTAIKLKLNGSTIHFTLNDTGIKQYLFICQATGYLPDYDYIYVCPWVHGERIQFRLSEQFSEINSTLYHYNSTTDLENYLLKVNSAPEIKSNLFHEITLDFRFNNSFVEVEPLYKNRTQYFHGPIQLRNRTTGFFSISSFNIDSLNNESVDIEWTILSFRVQDLSNYSNDHLIFSIPNNLKLVSIDFGLQFTEPYYKLL